MRLDVNPNFQADPFQGQMGSAVVGHLDLVGCPSAVDAGLVCWVHVGVVRVSLDVSLLELR